MINDRNTSRTLPQWSRRFVTCFLYPFPQSYPEDGLAAVVRNVFDFDSYTPETQDSLAQVLHKHGIPIGASARNLQLAKE